MLQRGRQLPADIRQILRVADAIGDSVKAADTAVPSVGQLAPLEHVHPIQAFGSVGGGDRPFALVLAGPQEEVSSRAFLAGTEDRTGSALDDLEALHRIVHADE